MTENPAIFELECKRHDLELNIRKINAEIQDIRNQCNHERVDHPSITNPWWCQKCGGEMPKLTNYDAGGKGEVIGG